MSDFMRFFVFLLALSVAVPLADGFATGMLGLRKSCEAKGGVYFSIPWMPNACIKRDSVIDPEDEK
jgi:hypothetical protein